MSTSIGIPTHQTDNYSTSSNIEIILAKRINVFSEILDSVWVIVVAIMVLLAQVGFVMKEAGSIRKI